jgi:hypothetical protein
MPTPSKPPSLVKRSVGVRLLPADFADVKKLADARRWSVSSYIEWVMSEHLAAARPRNPKNSCANPPKPA